ncbi:MAG TPA: type III-B CRISPR module-associated Cmr3 family protein [Opitutaceae bacterium]|nr:type III-B CRISPR module-associated Cmr3 family protein [Opitutaceae bacterium]HOD48207.1 type III-B CRISPR module-associated Cmr3 family protein [Opitutaceae bacterium]HOY55247.1 type III-B CRISPR module-associated Cmr3 family protein [Opitutaceae bacterium]
MNQLLLTPTDTLFFRDGRPMEGALAGHGAAWPLPTVTNAALHAALHDAQRSSALTGQVHHHDHMRGAERHLKDVRAFGSLVSTGSFPVGPDGTWFFPRPLDLTGATLAPTLAPRSQTGYSSLPAPLCATLISNQPPTKAAPAKAWLSAVDFTAYLSGSDSPPQSAVDDRDVFVAEASIGIALDSATGTTREGQLYSAHSLRLHEGWKIGLLACTDEKQPDGSRRDLLSQDLYPAGRGHLILGGQQRVCSVQCTPASPIPLPRGKHDNFAISATGKHLVKWVLLTPAVYPAITEGISKRGTHRQAHCGGWLPNWIDEGTGQVLLQVVDEQERLRRRKLNYAGRGYRSDENAAALAARLVAARIDKPLPITGWANGDDALGEESQSGAKSTHLAVPAGAVYYFACDSAKDAKALAAALNWHGDSPGTTIRNRRSTLLGEKGFGLGVCGTWQPHGQR